MADGTDGGEDPAPERDPVRDMRSLGSPARRPEADYEVGYGKPPVTSRFKPGRSGNPRGRPKGARNKMAKPYQERLKDIVLEEAYRTIEVNERGRSVTLPMAQAIVRVIAHDAVKGQAHAQKLFAELLGAMEAANKYKVEWDRELLRRRRSGIAHLPEPLPHPDNIRIDMRTCTVRITGPMQKVEVAD